MPAAEYSGQLVLRDGCLRIEGDTSYALVWPPGYGLDLAGETLQILDVGGRDVARVGDEIYIDGGVTPVRNVPAIDDAMQHEILNRCAEPYWFVGDQVRSISTSNSALATSAPNADAATPTVDSTTSPAPDPQLPPTAPPATLPTTAVPTTVSQEQLDDEERATQEAQEHQATVEAGIEDGELVDSPEELACAAEAQMVESPSLYLLCGNDIMPALSHTPFVRAETLAEAEALLTAYVLELLGEVDPTNASVGYASYFSDPSVLNSLTLSANGTVTVDFNDKFAEQNGQLHGSTAARMLEQLNRTLFQFREVNTVSVTLNGSCEAFAQLFEFSCVNLDRETWQEMLELNEAQVEMFNLTEE